MRHSKAILNVGVTGVGLVVSALLAGSVAAAPTFGDAGLDAVVDQLEARLARHLATAQPSEILFISAIDEARLTPSPGGDRICRPAHVSAARQGETIASADALACQSPAGTWTLTE